MPAYHLVSGVFFSVLAIIHIARFLMKWPVQVAGFDVPMWISAPAFLILAALAVWAFRSGRPSEGAVVTR